MNELYRTVLAGIAQLMLYEMRLNRVNFAAVFAKTILIAKKGG